jgi:hypothetical protein
MSSGDEPTVFFGRPDRGKEASARPARGRICARRLALVPSSSRAPIAVRYEQFPHPRHVTPAPTGTEVARKAERKEGSQWQQEP